MGDCDVVELHYRAPWSSALRAVRAGRCNVCQRFGGRHHPHLADRLPHPRRRRSRSASCDGSSVGASFASIPLARCLVSSCPLCDVSAGCPALQLWWH